MTSTLIEICRHQRLSSLLELLENGHAYFEENYFDRWNGGTTHWTLKIEIPVFLFASCEPQLDEIEIALLKKLNYLNRQHENDPVGKVSLLPIDPTRFPAPHLSISELDEARLWQADYLRLFLSHLSEHKKYVSLLKESLFEFGVSAFVAHEDIIPSLEWQGEIILALRSMHGLAALLTPLFHESNWVDQEIGWALGRGVPVFPVRLGSDPYGFVGKIQGTSGILEEPDALSQKLVETLLHCQQTRPAMRAALVVAMEKSNRFAISKRLRNVIVGIEDFSDLEKSRLKVACQTNSQVSRAHGVAASIYDKFGGPGKSGFSDEDVPF